MRPASPCRQCPPVYRLASVQRGPCIVSALEGRITLYSKPHEIYAAVHEQSGKELADEFAGGLLPSEWKVGWRAWWRACCSVPHLPACSGGSGGSLALPAHSLTRSARPPAVQSDARADQLLEELRSRVPQGSGRRVLDYEISTVARVRRRCHACRPTSPLRPLLQPRLLLPTTHAASNSRRAGPRASASAARRSSPSTLRPRCAELEGKWAAAPACMLPLLPTASPTPADAAATSLNPSGRRHPQAHREQGVYNWKINELQPLCRCCPPAPALPPTRCAAPQLLSFLSPSAAAAARLPMQTELLEAWEEEGEDELEEVDEALLGDAEEEEEGQQEQQREQPQPAT